MKKKSYKKRKRQIKTKRNKKGGSYYAYNKNPLRFTSSTSQMGGSGLSIDTRSTFLPQSLVNVGRMFGDVFTTSTATTTGSASLIPSDPTSQPIDSKTSRWNKI
jgi:hypothetical protein